MIPGRNPALILAALAALFGTTMLASAETMPKPTYPAPPKTNQVDDYHGVKIADPYRTLENADAPSTKKWVDDENALTFSWLAKQPGRDTIKTQLTALWNYEKFSAMYKAGPHYFYSHNTGLQNQAVLYVTDSLNGAAHQLLDPNTLSKDGTVALNGESVSWNGKLLAYAIARAGSDWNEWRVRDVATGKDLPDLIQWSKDEGVAWAPNDKGFYYARFPEPPKDQVLTASALNAKVYFHVLGNSQSADKLIYERPDQPKWSLTPVLMEGGRYLVLYISPAIYGKNLLSVIDLGSTNPRVVDLVSTVESEYDPIAVVGNLLYIHTNDAAPRGRVIAMDLTDHPDKSGRPHWKEIIPQKDETLDTVQVADGKILLGYMKDAHSIARLTTLDGKPIAEVEMPGLGSAGWSGARLGDKEMFFAFSGYTIGPGIYRLDLESGKTSVMRKTKMAFDASAYETKQIFYKSKDGTRVPMFLSYKKGIRLDGQNPTMLYGYGGFNLPETPVFQPQNIEWMQMGGIFAVANLRGGNEYGEAWHEAGMRARKQNVFDDFIAAAEWLIANRYTSTPKLAIYGASNGGLLIGAVLNQRPDLFGAAMPAVGVMDMLRFQHFGFGAQWAGEYGSSENPEDFKVLRAYSPLHNVRKTAQYPPVLITTSDHDDRVMPGHSLKYAATMQQAQSGAAPILIRIETQAGHGAGKPTSKRIDEWVDRLTFLHSVLKM